MLRHLRVRRGDVQVVPLTPQCEGCTVEIWVGFRHFNYLAEHAVLLCLRECDADVRALYWGEELCWQVVSSRARYQQALLGGDATYVCVAAESASARELRFRVSIVAERFGSMVTLGRVRLGAALYAKDGRRATRLPERLGRWLQQPAEERGRNENGMAATP